MAGQPKVKTKKQKKEREGKWYKAITFTDLFISQMLLCGKVRSKPTDAKDEVRKYIYNRIV